MNFITFLGYFLYSSLGMNKKNLILFDLCSLSFLFLFYLFKQDHCRVFYLLNIRIEQ